MSIFLLLYFKRNAAMRNFKFDIHKLIKIEAIAKDVNEKKGLKSLLNFFFKWNLCVFLAHSQQIENLCFFSPFFFYLEFYSSLKHNSRFTEVKKALDLKYF